MTLASLRGRAAVWWEASVLAAVISAAFVLQVVVTVLTHSHWRRDLQSLDLRLEAAALLAEELPAVPAVVAALREGETHGAARAAVHHLVLHPVVGCRAARLVTHRPAEHTAPTVAHQDLTVVLGDGEGCDFGRVSVVLAVERRVHGEFAPENQLALPSVTCSRKPHSTAA